MNEAIPILPALLQEITDPEPYLADPDFCAEEKLNGRRMLLVKKGSVVRAYSRNGNEFVAPRAVIEKMKSETRLTAIDGELVGDAFIAFDAPLCETYGRRRHIMAIHCPFETNQCHHGSVAKRELFGRVRVEGGEGIVFKRIDGLYQPGQRTYGYKYKFYQTATVKVMQVDLGTCNFGFIAEKEDATGRCTFPFNAEWPKIGQLWEVRYDEISIHGKLIRPRLLMRRDDLEERAPRH